MFLLVIGTKSMFLLLSLPIWDSRIIFKMLYLLLITVPVGANLLNHPNFVCILIGLLRDFLEEVEREDE